MRMTLALTVAALLAAVCPPAVAQQYADYELVLRPVRYEMDLRPDFDAGRLEGRARLSFTNVGDAPTAELSLMLYRLLSVAQLEDGDGNPIPFTQSVTAFEDFGKLQATYVEATLPEPVAPHGSAWRPCAHGRARARLGSCSGTGAFPPPPVSRNWPTSTWTLSPQEVCATDWISRERSPSAQQPEAWHAHS